MQGNGSNSSQESVRLNPQIYCDLRGAGDGAIMRDPSQCEARLDPIDGATARNLHHTIVSALCAVVLVVLAVVVTMLPFVLL